ncbi:hypothetical protein Lepto7375DRAFT_6849 [Leptolyngbya sp. PCC 7375]|nr:hypothetical protein Lepto7375DRAFT_6849 [Leptolyngbya sp. PCC 7375]
MTVLSLKTELDVAEFLLSKGWFPEEINGILVFPLPSAAFSQLGSKNHQILNSDVIKATDVTPTTLCRARQLLESAGWVERELDSLLKPCLYSVDPWANQTIHHYEATHQRCGYLGDPLPTLNHYRRAMALKRIVSLALVITMVSVAVVFFG